jgi:hypothetical protein
MFLGHVRRITRNVANPQHMTSAIPAKIARPVITLRVCACDSAKSASCSALAFSKLLLNVPPVVLIFVPVPQRVWEVSQDVQRTPTPLPLEHDTAPRWMLEVEGDPRGSWRAVRI